MEKDPALHFYIADKNDYYDIADIDDDNIIPIGPFYKIELQD